MTCDARWGGGGGVLSLIIIIIVIIAVEYRCGYVCQVLVVLIIKT